MSDEQRPPYTVVSYPPMSDALTGETVIPQGWPLWIGIREGGLSWADPVIGWLYNHDDRTILPVTFRGPVDPLEGRDWWIEPTEERASAAAEGEPVPNESLRRAAARAREIVVRDPDPEPPPMALGDTLEDAATHPERRVSRPPRPEVGPDVMSKLVFGEDGELPPATTLGDED